METPPRGALLQPHLAVVAFDQAVEWLEVNMWRHHGIGEKVMRNSGGPDGPDGPDIDVSDPSDIPNGPSPAPSPA